MKKILVMAALVTLIFTSKHYPQLGFAVAKNNNNSSVKWQLIWNSKSPLTDARNKLKNLGYDNVYTLPGGAECGHNLKSGYWVVIESNYKLSDGKRRTSFGAGASNYSFSEAECRAMRHLRKYDSNWTTRNGYYLSKTGTF